MPLQNFDPATFLAAHWQRTPCIIRDAWPSWTNPLDPDDLAGLACDPEVESRIVRRTKKTWQVEHGPFAAKRFDKATKHPWTLLVQAVDHAVPAVAALLDAFRFVPNWRVDDVMVSYATDGGGVGPHFDQYDVFLIQGLGQRRWRVGGRCDATTPLLPHDGLRLLDGFEPIDEWVLGPGDMLYVPPGFAHEGVAVGDNCMTYSVGFRAPSRAELIGGWLDDLLAALPDNDRYADPALAAQPNPGEIEPAAIDALHAMVTATMNDRAAFVRWFGEYASTRKYPDVDWSPEAPVTISDVRRTLKGGPSLRRNPASRFAFVRQGVDALLLFVDGATFECSGATAALAERLCSDTQLTVDAAFAALDPAIDLVTALLNSGSVDFDDGD